MNDLIILPVALPLLGAGVCILVGRSRTAQRVVSITTLVAVVVLSLWMVLDVDANGTLVTQAGGWQAPIGITLVADRFAAMVLSVSAAMVLAEMKTTESVRGWAQLVADILMRDTARSTFTHRRAVRAAAWSPDGERIVTASADHSARIWTANRDRDPTPLVGHDDEVLDAQWSPDGEHILTTSADHSARSR